MDFLDRLERIKKQVIVALFSDARLLELLVLKGGTAIDLYQYPSSRSSIDIDFSLDGQDFDEPLEHIKQRIVKRLTQQMAPIGCHVFDVLFGERPKKRGDQLPDFWGGYLLEFKLIQTDLYEKYKEDIDTLRRQALIVGEGQRRKFSVDFSKCEFCSDKVESEIDDYVVYMYTPAMIVVEKLRAICQQMPDYPYGNHTPRARDFYDICLILTHEEHIDFHSDALRTLLKHCFAAKEVDMTLLLNIPTQGTYQFHEPDFYSLKDTISAQIELKEFSFYHDFVSQKVHELQEFWNK